jgi:hypothetical protein
VKKKLLPLLAFIAIITAALVPVGVANAASYYPGYTCHYRDIAGSCLSYQTQNPYFFNGSYGAGTRSLYGNRQTYPFRAMFNAQSTTQHKWDNRHNNKNNYYHGYRYEDNDDGELRWYFDEEDDTYRRYRYQSSDHYKQDNLRRHHRNNINYYEEYEHTRYICTGGDCSSTYIRY